MVLFLRFTVLVAVLLVTCNGFRTLHNQKWRRSYTLQATKEPNILDNILNTPAKVQQSLNEAQKNIQQTTDNILQTPDRIAKRVNNVVARVEATKTKIEKTAADAQRIASIPVTLFQKVVNVIDGKGSTEEEELVPTKYPRSEKSSMDIFEDVKESAYATYDTLVAVTEGVKATAETIKKLPADINEVQIKAAVTAENIQKDLGKVQQQAEVAGKVLVKIVTGEAVQETMESALDTYTKTKVATEKTIESVQAFVKDPISIVKGPPPVPPTPPPPPPPPPKKTEVEIKMTETVNTMKGSLETVKGNLETVKESLETVKAVSAATVTTAKTLSKGAMGLKERIAKNLEAQGLASPSSTMKDPTKPKAMAPPPIPVFPSSTTSNYFSDVKPGTVSIKADQSSATTSASAVSTNTITSTKENTPPPTVSAVAVKPAATVASTTITENPSSSSSSSSSNNKPPRSYSPFAGGKQKPPTDPTKAAKS